MTKTKNDVERLKQSWLKDPCWDIETTEGFEDHKSALLTFRLKKEKEWEENADMEYWFAVGEKAKAMNIESNIPLAEYIYRLEQRLSRFEDIVNRELNELQNDIYRNS